MLNCYLSYATLLGNFFSPIGGVLVFDYVFLKRTRLDVPALFTLNGRYRYWGGFNLVAIAWTALGFLFYMFVVPPTWIPTVCTIALQRHRLYADGDGDFRPLTRDAARQRTPGAHRDAGSGGISATHRIRARPGDPTSNRCSLNAAELFGWPGQARP